MIEHSLRLTETGGYCTGCGHTWLHMTHPAISAAFRHHLTWVWAVVVVCKHGNVSAGHVVDEGTSVEAALRWLKRGRLTEAGDGQWNLVDGQQFSLAVSPVIGCDECGTNE